MDIDVNNLTSLNDLKSKPLKSLITFAGTLEIENATDLKKQDLIFAILKKLAEKNIPITGSGVLEVLQDGYGF